MPGDFKQPIYRYDPTGYGDWGSPYYFAEILTESHEGYNGEGKKTTYVRTDFNTWWHDGTVARLYVPEGVNPYHCGLSITPIETPTSK